MTTSPLSSRLSVFRWSALLLCLWVALALAPSPPVLAAEGAFPVGELVEGVATLADPEQTYTLYLPPGYEAPAGGGEPPRRWPVLLIFDPRGRSRHGAERFVAGAETFGWILISSDGTRSDGPWEPNAKALRALLPELDRRFPVDPRRVYAAGFSGGAHVGWLLGLSGGLAGVIASGGRPSPEWMVEEIPFASFGAAGTTDFNFAGMHEVDAHFARRGAPHRMEVFDGRHGWMPPDLALEAVGWMEVVAMQQGRRPVDRELAAGILAADLARAREMEDAGEPLWAARRYRAILRTYEPLLGDPKAGADTPDEDAPGGRTTEGGRSQDAAAVDGLPGAGPATVAPEKDPPRPAVAPDLAAVAARLEALAGSAAYRAALPERERWDGYEAAYRSRLGAALLELEDPQRPMTPDRLAKRLEVRRLHRLAGEGSSVQRRTARRLLETVFVQTAFYLPRDLRASHQHRKTAVVLEVASRIRPDDPVVLYNLACARALAGRRVEALEALRSAVGAGFADAALLETDPDLETLREEPAFRQLLERLG